MNPEWESVSEWVNQQPTLRWQVQDKRELPAYTLDPFPSAPPIIIDELIATNITARIGPTCSVLVCWMTQQGFGEVTCTTTGHELIDWFGPNNFSKATHMACRCQEVTE